MTTVVVPNVVKPLYVGLDHKELYGGSSVSIRSLFIRRLSDGRCYTAATDARMLRVLSWREQGDGPFEPAAFVVDVQDSDLLRIAPKKGESLRISLLGEPDYETPAEVEVLDRGLKVVRSLRVMTRHDLLHPWLGDGYSPWFRVLPLPWHYEHKPLGIISLNARFLTAAAKVIEGVHKALDADDLPTVTLGSVTTSNNPTLHLSERFKECGRFGDVVFNAVVMGRHVEGLEPEFLESPEEKERQENVCEDEDEAVPESSVEV